uniref:Uncharacterized protein n=1 Tax=Anguilla anguilla TaxID=7936 RepID=A0A0E9W5H1_ANGAN
MVVIRSAAGFSSKRNGCQLFSGSLEVREGGP